MKRVFALISMASAATAAGIRGDAVEEVGEPIEHYPPQHGGYDRRSLLDEMEMDAEILGSYEVTALDAKESFPDEGSVEIADGTLYGEGLDQHDRRDRQCTGQQSLVKFDIMTDSYGWEFKWRLLKVKGGSNQLVTSGPPEGSNYGRSQRYIGAMCLGPGNYKLRLTDQMGDGMCSPTGRYGCGYMKTYIDGEFNQAASLVDNKTDWKNMQMQFTIAQSGGSVQITQGRSDTAPSPGPFDINAGEGGRDWCQVARSAMNGVAHTGTTCTVPGTNTRGHRVKVIVKVDQFGSETSVSLTRNGGSASLAMPADIPAYGQKAKEECLPAGSYTFKITDFDGVCCKHGEGFYKVLVDGKQLFQGGSFRSEEVNKITLGHDWIGEMSQRDCEWWYAHHLRRQDWHTRGNPSRSGERDSQGNAFGPSYYPFLGGESRPYNGLKWSQRLEADAKTYADELLAGCEEDGISHDSTDQGENLAKNRGSGGWGIRPEADKIVKRFTDNEEYWGWNRNAHLTQAVWYSSEYIGCSESVIDMNGNGKMCRYFVCRYARAGNCLMGQFDSYTGNNWREAMMQDLSPCGPTCPPGNVGCHH